MSLEALPGAVVFDLSHAPHQEKLEHLRSVLAALATLRRHTGLPHRIVVDEAHYFLHDANTLKLLDLELSGCTLVRYRASKLHPKVLPAHQAIMYSRIGTEQSDRAREPLRGGQSEHRERISGRREERSGGQPWSRGSSSLRVREAGPPTGILMPGDAIPRVRCVLFDLYGTLVDIRLNEDSFELWEGLAIAIQHCGGAVANPLDVRTRFQQILRDEGKRRQEGFLMEPTFRRLLSSLGATDDVAYLGRRFRQLSTEALTVRPYVEPLFNVLRRRSSAIGIVSNTEAVLTRFDLDRCPLLLSADTVVLSSEVGVRKPDPRIFQIALERLHAEPASAVVVGNSVAEDIDGARRAGLHAVYLDDRSTGIEPMREETSVLRVRPAYEDLARALEISFTC